MTDDPNEKLIEALGALCGALIAVDENNVHPTAVNLVRVVLPTLKVIAGEGDA